MLSYLDFCNLSKNFFSVSFGGFISIFTIINYESFIELSLLKNLIKLKCLFNDIEFNYFLLIDSIHQRIFFESRHEFIISYQFARGISIGCEIQQYPT